MEWSSDSEKNTQSNSEQTYYPDPNSQDEKFSYSNGMSEESYEERDEERDEDREFVKNGNVPTKNLIAILILLSIGFLVVFGYTSDIRVMLIIGLSFVGLLLISLIIGLVKNHRISFWDAVILADLLRLLGYIIYAIFRIAIEIVKES